MRAATEGHLPLVMPQGNLVEVLGREVRKGSPGELMVESSPSRQRRPPCKTSKEMSDEAADAADLTHLLTYSPGRHHERHRRPMSTSPSPHRPRRGPRSPRRPYPSTTPSPRHHHSGSPGRHQARHRCPMSTSPTCFPLRPYPFSTPSPRHRRSRSPRHRHHHHHHRSTSSARRSRTLGTDPSPPQAPTHLAWWSAPALQELRRRVRWAGGAGRQDGVHMVHTFEEMRTRTPADLNEAAPNAIMPQAAWEALLRDAVQGLRPPLHPSSPPQMAPGHPPPGLGHRRPLPTPPPPDQEGEGQGQGEGKGHQGALRQEGTEGPQVKARTHWDGAPEETPHGGRQRPKNQEGAGAGTKARRKRTPRQTPRPTPRKGIPRRGDQRRPTPTEGPTTPGGACPNTHRRSKHRTPYGSQQRTPTSHRKPHGEWRAHLHGESEPHPQRKPQGTPPHGAPPRPHCQATTLAATRATSQAPEEDEGTATASRARDPNPQRTRDQGTGPQGGQPDGRLPDPPAWAARPGFHSTDPARHPHLTACLSHQPATLRPALRTTTQARLTSTDPPRHNARPRHTAPQRATVQRATARRDATRHRAAQHGTTDPSLKD